MDTSIFPHSKPLLGSMPQGVFGAADLFCTVSSLSARLGYQSPLLDEYISAVLESAATFSAYDAQSHGYEAASRLMELARGVTPIRWFRPASACIQSCFVRGMRLARMGRRA